MGFALVGRALWKWQCIDSVVFSGGCTVSVLCLCQCTPRAAAGAK